MKVALWFYHSASQQPSPSLLFPVLPECAAAPACAVGPAASVTPTRTKARNEHEAVCSCASKS